MVTILAIIGGFFVLGWLLDILFLGLFFGGSIFFRKDKDKD